jgi:hypothetical protein
VRAKAAAFRIGIRLTPRAARDGIEGSTTLADGSVVLQARVTAPPDKGKANAALVALAAKAFGVPKGAVSIVSGETARLKILEITGDRASLAQRAADLLKSRP